MIARDPFSFSSAELQTIIESSAPYVPELEMSSAQLQLLTSAPQTQLVLGQTLPMMEGLAQIPVTSYTAYRRFRHDGDRQEYEAPYFLKRERLSVAALRLFLGETQYKGAVQDYIWNVCEESNWVVPAHETPEKSLDLFCAETGFLLAETLALLGNTLDVEVRHRVRMEVERRVFDPYILYHDGFWWYKGTNNWNGVCNSSVAATFLLLEPESARSAQALSLALAGLKVFLDTAFEADGSSAEGVAYWQYGLTNFVFLAEMLYARSRGELNLLGTEQIRRIAAYPAKMQLSGSSFASFSDCHETVLLQPSILARLAQRTGEHTLLNLLATPAAPTGSWLPTLLRTMLWWDGRRPEAAPLADSYLPAGATARLVGHTLQGVPVAVAIKAGHNGVSHNQNDIGSFIVHAGGENLLTDPGPGLYSRQYFGPERYDNVFANSYGHSVPRIAGQLQGTGHDYCGEMVSVETAGPHKQVVVEFARAYPVPSLTSARREVTLQTEGGQVGTVWLDDHFQFSAPEEVEEAFVTWCEVQVDGATATVRDKTQQLRMTVESPAGATFQLEVLKQQSEANKMDGVLKRLSLTLPAARESDVRIRMEPLRT